MTKDVYQEDPHDDDTDDGVVSLDADLANADWTKQSWDLPPYGTAEFYEAIGGVDQLEAFKKLPVYNHAVELGLIHDDEWVDHHVRRIIPKE